MAKKGLYHFLLFFFYITILFSVYINIVYGNVQMINSFPVYIAQDRAFSFQLSDNITQVLTLTATINTFNVTTNTLLMLNDEGEFSFTPNADSTIRINHNMNYVQIRDYNDTTDNIQVNNGDSFDMYEDKYTIIIFQIKGYDVSGVVTQIAFFIISVTGLIVTPPISDIASKNDKMQQMFMWVCGWLFFGMLFLTWIYSG